MKKTREILLKTAAKMFSQYGFDGVSTRELAKKSGVNLCSINYYFGSKQKLYDAVMDDVYSFIEQNLIIKIKRLIMTNPDDLSPREYIKQIVVLFVSSICGTEVPETTVELLFKELIKPTSSYNRFFSQIFEPIHKRLTKLMSEDTGIQDEAKLVLLAHTLLGQGLMFKIHKEALLRRLGIKEYTPELLAEIQRQIMQNIDAILDRAKEN